MLKDKVRYYWIAFTLILIFQAPQSLLANSVCLSDNYGNLVTEDSIATVWWAPSTYKISPLEVCPKEKGRILVKAARNEKESFQLIVNPKVLMAEFRVKSTDLYGKNGKSISSDNVDIFEEVYVHVTVPTDKYAQTGYYPDPIPSLDGPLSLTPSTNKPILIRINIPKNTTAGIYHGTLKLSSGDWNQEVPFELKVWDFTLPDTTHLRSAFGVSPSRIAEYHHIKNKTDLRGLMDKYYRIFSEERLSPYNPFALYPMKVNILGKRWEGGRIVTDNPYRGHYALQIEDNSVSNNVKCQLLDTIKISPDKSYKLSWFARTKENKHEYSVLIKCFNREDKYLPVQNKIETFKGDQEWNGEKILINKFPPSVDHITIELFATFRDKKGTYTGTTWFDNVEFKATDSKDNLIKDAGFELNVDSMNVVIDFSEFDKAGERYLDTFGFNSFRLGLKGMGGGTFYARHKGYFGGFEQGTEGYDKLFGSYLRQVQDHLGKKGWLKKAYVYWFDEPSKRDYPFVRSGMKYIHRFAPKLTRLITQNNPGPKIMDVTEISTTILGELDKAEILEAKNHGYDFWSYVCTSPKAPYINEFIDHKAINLRIWSWLSWDYELSGLLLWETVYWNSPTVFPPGHLQNPWEDPMSYVHGYGSPYGRVQYWGNGDGRYFYPPDRNAPESKKPDIRAPVRSIRLEYIRDGIEDYEYFYLLKQKVKQATRGQEKLVQKAKELLEIPESIVKSNKEYTKDPEKLTSYREKIAKIIVQFND